MRLLNVILILLSITPLFSQSTFEETIDHLFEQYDSQSPGVSVLISKGDSVLYKKCFGQANLEYEIPISSNTTFNATSLSKQFVAFGIYLLEKEGKLSFNDNIQGYVSDLPDYTKSVKIAHLLSHTSGIRDQWGLLTLAGYKIDDFISNEAILNLIISQKELNFEHGTQFEYSHSNYTLLAQVIESISGISLNEYLKKTVFDPLNMDRTFFLDSSKKIIKDRSYSYELVNESYNKVNLNYQNYGPTNLMTTVDDLSKWVSSLSNYLIASYDLINAFDAIATLNDGSKVLAVNLGDEKIFSCNGQFFRLYKGFRFISHGGSLGGFRSFIGRFPDEKLSIILLGNDDTLTTYATALNIADKLLGLNDEPMEATKSKIEISENKDEIYPENPEQYLGDYFNASLNTYIKLIRINEQLQASIGRSGKHNLVYINTDEFNANFMHPVTMKFLRNEGNGIKGIAVSSLGVSGIIFEKVILTTFDN